MCFCFGGGTVEPNAYAECDPGLLSLTDSVGTKEREVMD